MDIHVDWLSFTLKEYEPSKSAAALYTAARTQMRKKGKEYEQVIFGKQGFDPSSGRPPYRVAIARDDNGARVYGSSHTDTILFEISGRGCEAIRQGEVARWYIGGFLESITRIDFAVDIRTRTMPSSFANDREHNKFRSISFIRSATGETVYVGSPKSDRFCRVYRYNHPHPRAELLRVEFVFRRKLARAASTDYCETENDAEYIGKLGATYGFAHGDWKPGVRTNEVIKTPITTRKSEETVYWLYKQVAPAVRRVLNSGEFDMTEWLEYVYGSGVDSDK